MRSRQAPGFSASIRFAALGIVANADFSNAASASSGLFLLAIDCRTPHHRIPRMRETAERLVQGVQAILDQDAFPKCIVEVRDDAFSFRRARAGRGAFFDFYEIGNGNDQFVLRPIANGFDLKQQASPRSTNLTMSTTGNFNSCYSPALGRVRLAKFLRGFLGLIKTPFWRCLAHRDRIREKKSGEASDEPPSDNNAAFPIPLPGEEMAKEHDLRRHAEPVFDCKFQKVSFRRLVRRARLTTPAASSCPICGSECAEAESRHLRSTSPGRHGRDADISDRTAACRRRDA